MKVLLPRYLVSMLVVLAGVGCGHNRPAVVQVRPEPPSRPLVFYDEKGEPSEGTPKLSQAEFDRIVSRIAVKTREPVWFIRVKPTSGDGPQRATIVYLVPRGQTARTRRGRAYHLWVDGQESGISAPWQYIQISGPGRTFTSRLDLPSARDLPFERENMTPSDQELIRISDFVRQPSNYEASIHQLAPAQEAGKVVHDVQELPVFHIWGSSKNINVWFGYLHGSLWGGGVSLGLERTEMGYRLKTWCFWVS